MPSAACLHASRRPASCCTSPNRDTSEHTAQPSMCACAAALTSLLRSLPCTRGSSRNSAGRLRPQHSRSPQPQLAIAFGTSPAAARAIVPPAAAGAPPEGLNDAAFAHLVEACAATAIRACTGTVQCQYDKRKWVGGSSGTTSGVPQHPPCQPSMLAAGNLTAPKPRQLGVASQAWRPCGES